MNKEPNRSYLWPLEPGNTPSADLTTQFTKLQKLALAYGTKGSTLYQDDKLAATIIDGLDFMVTQKDMMGKSTTEIGGTGKLVCHRSFLIF